MKPRTKVVKCKCGHDMGEHYGDKGNCLLERWRFDEWERCDCKKFRPISKKGVRG